VAETQAIVDLLPSRPKPFVMRRRRQLNSGVLDSMRHVSSQVRVINFVHSLPQNHDLKLTLFFSLRRRLVAGEYGIFHDRTGRYLWIIVSYSHDPLFASVPTTTSNSCALQIQLFVDSFSNISSHSPRPSSPLLISVGTSLITIIRRGTLSMPPRQRHRLFGRV
jgi:hypothetical protein